VGDAFRRFGPRRVVLGGMLAMGAAAASFPALTAAWQVYLVFAVMALGWAAMSGASVNAIVAEHFDARRGLAVSLALNGASFGGVLVAPALIASIFAFGFRDGLLLGVAAMVVVLTPTVLLALPRHGARSHAGPSAPPRPAAALLRERALWTICAAFALGLLSQVGFLTHQVAFVAASYGAAEAASVVGITSLAAVAGRVGLGFFVDRIDRRRAAAANFALQIGALALLLWAPGRTGLYAGCLLFGLGVGNMITLPALIVQREFEAASFARAMSLVTAINQFTFAFGPAILGWLRQRSGDYDGALLLCMALHATAAVLVLARPGGGATTPRRPATPAA